MNPGRGSEHFEVEPAQDFDAWRLQARSLVTRGIDPARLHWRGRSALHLAPSVEGAETASAAPSLRDDTDGSLRVPRSFMSLAKHVACHADPARWGLLYAALWRLTHGEPYLFEIAHDPLVVRLRALDSAVRRELHKAKAFVRFERVPESDPDGTPRYAAWFEPRFAVVELVAPFFAGRFANMPWTLLTPIRCAEWDGKALRYVPGIERPEGTGNDPLLAAWKVYYASIFNPARVKLAAMRREMPQRYWRNLPETAEIPRLIVEAPKRVERMIARAPESGCTTRNARRGGANARAPGAPESLPLSPKQCRLCPHAAAATQAVLGEGPEPARLMLVGEQPGDREDLAGRPFVGPAGEVLDRALREAGLERAEVFLTNAVKHFYWQPRGKRRLHKRPDQAMVLACRGHLLGEIERVRPRVIVCLGRTAWSALTYGTPLSQAAPARGALARLPSGVALVATWHPAYVLRAEPAAAARAEAEIASALRLAREAAEDSAAPAPLC